MTMKIRIILVASMWCTVVAMPVHAEVSIGPTIIRTGTTIEILEPGPDIQAIIDDIGDADADNPYLIKLGPGEYTIEADITTSEGLVMAQYISIMGSGQGVTILKGGISSGSFDGTSAIVTGADDAALSDMTVINTGGNSKSIAIINSDASPRIERVTVTASGGTTENYGVSNISSSPTMIQVTATGDGGSHSGGVSNSGSSPTMTLVTATGEGGTTTNGIWNGSGTSSPTMSQVTATGKDGTRNYGVHNNSSSSEPRIEFSFWKVPRTGYNSIVLIPVPA